MDAEQIRQRMEVTRASIDRKLDALAVRTSAAREDALRRVLAGTMIGIAALSGVWWWRRRARAWTPAANVLVS